MSELLRSLRMTVEELLDERPTVTASWARRAVEGAGLDWSDFASCVGDADAYDGAEVLEWLGY